MKYEFGNKKFGEFCSSISSLSSTSNKVLDSWFTAVRLYTQVDDDGGDIINNLNLSTYLFYV